MKFTWHILFSQSFEELAKCSQNLSCGQCDVSKRLAYRHILKSIVKRLEEKNQKFSFSKLDLSLSVHMRSAVLLPPLQTIYVPITSACHSSDFSLVGSFFV